MSETDKKALKETEIRTRYITPAILRAGWDLEKNQVRENYTLAPGKVVVRGKLHAREAAKFADYVLFLKPGLPLAVVEAKDDNHSLGAGMQQAPGYADRLDAPFVFSSNGDGFLFHDRTVTSGEIERELTLGEFPSPDDLHRRWRVWKGVEPGVAETQAIEQDYFQGKELRSRNIETPPSPRSGGTNTDIVTRGPSRRPVKSPAGTRVLGSRGGPECREPRSRRTVRLEDARYCHRARGDPAGRLGGDAGRDFRAADSLSLCTAGSARKRRAAPPGAGCP